MSTTLQPSYSASGAGTSITITSAATLANGNAAGCTGIDNTGSLYIDATVQILATLANTSPGSDQLINIWFAASEDGTNYTSTNGANLDNYTGADAAVTLQSPTLFRGPFSIPTPNQNLATRVIIPSVVKFFGGLVLPKKWGFIVENRSGMAFTAFSAEFTGINMKNV